MAERSVSYVVGESYRLGQQLIKAQSAADRPSDLAHLECVGETRPEMVIEPTHKDLSLPCQPPEFLRVQHSVPIA